MNKLKLLIGVTCVLLALANGSIAQSISYEQVAFDYFFNTIYEKGKVKKWLFYGKTQTIGTQCFHSRGPCFNDELNNKEDWRVAAKLCAELDSAARGMVPSSLLINTVAGRKYLYLRSKWPQQNRRMQIYRASQVGNRNYVKILLSRLHHFSTYYIIELDENKNVIRWCRISEMQ